MLAPQKLAKDCLSDVGFRPFLTKHKGMLVHFKRTLDKLLLTDSDSPKKATKVAHPGVPGMVVVDDYSVAESLSTSSPSSLACFSSKNPPRLSRRKQRSLVGRPFAEVHGSVRAPHLCRLYQMAG
jgi:hypothetical protein